MGQILKQLKDAVVLMVRTQPQEDEPITGVDLRQLFNQKILLIRSQAEVEDWLFLES
jgi:hypothetical protein